MLAAAIGPGVLIGAALGLLGGGGSVLTVPIFVYLLGFSPKEAIAMSLAVVAGTSAFGAASHWRAGSVNTPIAVVFSTMAMLGTFMGVRLARLVPGTTQLLIFAGVTLVAAVFMLRGHGWADEQTRDTIIEPPYLSALKVVPAALLVGTLTGIVGVGGGFLIVPALVLMRLPIRKAVGTSLLVITGTCVVGVVGYLGHVQLNWVAVAVVGAGTLPGIMLGAYVHRFVPQTMLRRGFAAFLVVVAAFIFFESLGLPSAFSQEHYGTSSSVRR